MTNNKDNALHLFDVASAVLAEDHGLRISPERMHAKSARATATALTGIGYALLELADAQRASRTQQIDAKSVAAAFPTSPGSER